MSPKLLRPRASGFDPRSISGLALWLDAADASSLYTTDAGPVTAVSAPTEISGCALWLDASDASTITQSGGVVSQWRDKTVNARHFSASSTAQPAYTGTLNGLPVLTFNGSANTMTGNSAAQSAIRNLAGYTVIAVCKPASVAAGERLLLGAGATVIFRIGQQDSRPYAGGRRVAADALENITSSATGALVVGTAHIHSATVNHTSQTLSGRLSGAEYGSDTTYMASGLSENSDLSINVGSQSSGYGFYNGDIAELIIFNTALSTADRARVEAYLAAKWGIAGVHAQATATSDPVGYWRDKSGNNRHATQATGASRPTVSANTQNSKKMLSFDGTNGRLNIAHPVAQNDPVAMIAVARRGSTTWGGGGSGGYGSIINSSGGTSAGPQLRVDTGNIEVIGGSNRSSISGSLVGVGSCAIITGTVTSRDTALYVQGALVDADAGAGAISTGGTTTAIGAWNPATQGGGPLQCDVAELIVYRASLSAAQRQAIHRYLASKWGIVLAPQVSNADAQDWVNRVYANGGQVSSTTASAVNTFCNSIDAAGLRDRFYRLNLFCGTADASLIAVRTPLYRGQSLAGTQFGNTLDTNVNLVAATDYVETGATGGLTGTGNNGVGAGSTKYLNTGLTPTTIGVNSFHVSAYIYGLNQTGPSQSSPIGIRDNNAPSNRWGFDYRQTTTQWHAGASLGNTIPNPSVSAYRQYLATRSSATAASVYSNGVLAATDTTDVSASLQSRNVNFFVLAQNTDTVPAAYFPYRMGGYSLGISMNDSQAAAFHAAMLAFSQTMGRQ
jgi:hypothetical protein